MATDMVPVDLSRIRFAWWLCSGGSVSVSTVRDKIDRQ